MMKKLVQAKVGLVDAVELVQHLNEDGLAKKKAPAPEELNIVANRFALTQAYLQQDYVQNDKVLTAAFLQADNDLRMMLENAATAAANPPPVPPAR